MNSLAKIFQSPPEHYFIAPPVRGKTVDIDMSIMQMIKAKKVKNKTIAVICDFSDFTVSRIMRGTYPRCHETKYNKLISLARLTKAEIEQLALTTKKGETLQ